MPTYLRRFYLQKLSDIKQKESKQLEKSRSKMTNSINNVGPLKSKPVSRFKR